MVNVKICSCRDTRDIQVMVKSVHPHLVCTTNGGDLAVNYLIK